MLIVTPIGIEKEEILGEIPIFSVQNFIVNGTVTLAELVAKGILTNPANFFYGIGEILPNIKKT